MVLSPSKSVFQHVTQYFKKTKPKLISSPSPLRILQHAMSLVWLCCLRAKEFRDFSQEQSLLCSCASWGMYSIRPQTLHHCLLISITVWEHTIFFAYFIVVFPSAVGLLTMCLNTLLRKVSCQLHNLKYKWSLKLTLKETSSLHISS